ncbi:MAG: M1 family metallopeptidase [Bacteroidetes bacterium]|nr:M1 family metallopeptidase [Bacteroidota bacterium]
MKQYVLTLLALVTILTSRAQDKTTTYLTDPSSDPPDLAITLKHIRANVSFKPEETLVLAKTEFSFFPNRYRTDSIVFYTPEFTIKSIRISGKDFSVDLTSDQWILRGSNLVLYPPSALLKIHTEYELIIDYTAHPGRGAVYFVGWRPEEKGKRKEIWAHRPHGWLPYMDARITMDMYFTFDRNYKVFANGERMEVKDNPDSTRTWHYRMAKDHPYFSTALVIGDYDYKTSKSGNGVPLEFWYYKGQEDKVQPTYQYTGAMMDFLEKETGLKYPYPVYRQAPVIDYMYGAMETTTSTVFGDFIFIDPHAFWQRNYINTNVHEMAHQWFGNYIAHFVNKDVWLTESFATFYAKIFERSVFGEDYYENVMNDERNLALNAAKQNNYPVGGSMGGNPRIYQKGSLVLAMLRKVMGDREFQDAVRLYLDRYGFKYAQTADLLRCIYDATGKSYNWFFEEWVLHGGEPDYKVSYTVLDDTTGRRSTHISVTQVQETNNLIGLFKMPVDIEVHYKDGKVDSAVSWIENKYNEIIIPNSGKKIIDFVLFDPGREVLKKVTFEKSFEELSAQAMKAPHMIDRYDALYAMRLIPLSQKRDLLVKCYQKETFHLTKSEIIDQLATDRNDHSIDLFRQALNDPDANVRKTFLKDVTPIPNSLKADAEKALNDFSYLNQELALQNLCQSFPENTERYLDSAKNLIGWRGLNIRMKWLEIAVGKGKKEFLPELIDYSGPKYEFETRMNAFSVLKKLMYTDETVLANARSASIHWNFKLRDAAKEYLTYFGK